jgi:chromosome partitioning protein
MNAQIISVANQKGGVAKTTTCISLGGVLVESGYRVLLVDLDAQANLTLALGKPPDSLMNSTACLLLDGSRITNITRLTQIPALDLLPAHAELIKADRVLSVRKNPTLILKNSLRSLDEYDYILIDCPPQLGMLTMNALVAANLVIIPTQAEYFSAYALRNMVQTITRIQQGENPLLEYRVLITLFDVRNRIHRSVREQLYQHFGEYVFREMIQIDTKLRESVVVGVPISLYAPKSRSAYQYRSLIQEISGYAKKESIAQPA